MVEIHPEQFPRIRSISPQPVQHRGRDYLLLRDPLLLSERMVLVPHHLAPVLGLCDGTTPRSAMGSILSQEFNLHVDPDEIDALLSVLDESFLLENERASHMKLQVLEAYRQAEFRPPVLAGNSYPSSSDEVRSLLDGYTQNSGHDINQTRPIRGLISPHIDYERGWRVYAQVWKQAQEAVTSADLVVILGTDHHGPDGIISLTHQNYATPFGILPTARDSVDTLAHAIGPEVAFKGEIYHRGEHSIELAAVWLHYMRAGKPCQLLPILCGSFAPFIHGEASLEEDHILAQAAHALQTILTSKPSIVVAAADLAHVGPAFNGAALDLHGHAQLHFEDQKLIRSISAGDPQAFVQVILDAKDQFNVCGTSAIYLTLKALGSVQGELVDYEHCPADAQDASAVSICGMTLH